MIPTIWNRRLSPLGTLNEMRREMDRLFGSLPDWTEPAAWMVPADVRETDDAVEYTIEIPGMRPEDINLTVENDVLTVSGEKKFEREEGKEDSGYHLTERRYGRFERSFRVPASVKADDVTANYENGVLTVTLPRAEESRPRRIQVKSGNGRRIGAGRKS